MKDKRIDNYVRLLHIREAIEDIENFTHNISKETFLNEQILSSAVLFQFSVIGEAIVHIEPSLLEIYDYPWYKVRAFRNLISHEYFNIKMDAVWNIIINDLPKLKQVVKYILDREFS